MTQKKDFSEAINQRGSTHSIRDSQVALKVSSSPRDVSADAESRAKGNCSTLGFVPYQEDGSMNDQVAKSELHKPGNTI